MSRYDGDGELVLGSFKTIRAFRRTHFISDPLQAITHGDTYSFGKEYVAECRNTTWDIKKLLARAGFADAVGANIINVNRSRNLVNFNGVWEIRIAVAPKSYYHTSQYWPPTAHYYGEPVHYIDVRLSDREVQECFFKHEEAAPVRGCSCGFYSFYGVPTILSKGLSYIPGPEMYEFGVVENYGKVVHCEYGLRSEKMKVLASGSFFQIRKLIDDYPLDVFDVEALTSSGDAS